MMYRIIIHQIKKEDSRLVAKGNFGIDLTSRICILGLNVVTDKLLPIEGSLSRNGRLRIGIFTQHSVDKFDLQYSSVENMLQMFDSSIDQEMRSWLVKFQI